MKNFNTKLYWNPETIDEFVEEFKTNDFANVSVQILDFVINNCDDSETSVQYMFNDLITEVESNINYK